MRIVGEGGRIRMRRKRKDNFDNDGEVECNVDLE